MDNTDENNLDIEKSNFIYSSQELNSLLDVVKKAQVLYLDFLPIDKTSFINPVKLVGDNPFIIEQTLNDYSEQSMARNIQVRSGYEGNLIFWIY